MLSIWHLAFNGITGIVSISKRACVGHGASHRPRSQQASSSNKRTAQPSLGTQELGYKRMQKDIEGHESSKQALQGHRRLGDINRIKGYQRRCKSRGLLSPWRPCAHLVLVRVQRAHDAQRAHHLAPLQRLPSVEHLQQDLCSVESGEMGGMGMGRGQVRGHTAESHVKARDDATGAAVCAPENSKKGRRNTAAQQSTTRAGCARGRLHSQRRQGQGRSFI